MTRIEIFINSQKADIIEDNIQLRLNRTLWSPEKTATRQTEWSFSFDLPDTPTNNKIFNHANILAVTNKYHQRYKAEVYADGVLIYDGTMIINEYNAKTKLYNCNLVNIKTNTLDDIFGEEVMTEGEWYVPFEGVPTINSINADMTSKYFFPYVVYGAPQKFPITEDEVGKTFSSKHVIDGSNKYWVQSFPPSLNVLETVKKLFENKGYTVGGSAFQDEDLANIFASTSLADGQDPDYNVGNPLFGDVSVSINFQTGRQAGVIQPLDYQYEKVIKPTGDRTSTSNILSKDASDYDYNFSDIFYWNLLDTKNGTVTNNHKQYVFDPTEQVVVVPADGWYDIVLTANVSITTPTATVTALYHTFDTTNDEMVDKYITINKDLLTTTPVEIQLIKNYDTNIELIKGKTNVTWLNGNPNDQTYNYAQGTRRYKEGGYTNKKTWTTCFPHEDLYMAFNPTSTNELTPSFSKQSAASIRAQYADKTRIGTGERVSTFGSGDGTATGSTTTDTTTGVINGYVYGDNQTMAYDPVVSSAFICGLSSLSNGTVAVAKDGKSWSPLGTETNDILTNVKGYYKLAMDGTQTLTSLNYNSLRTTANQYCTITKNSAGRGERMTGAIRCFAYLKKNDMLMPVCVTKAFDGEKKYDISGTCYVRLRALGDEPKAVVRADDTWTDTMASRFPTQLNLFNFTNNQTKKSDWISNILEAFNLELSTVGNRVEIDLNKGIKKDYMNYAVNIDDRASSDDAVSSRIDYPRTMSVKYKIATKEAGFEESVPADKIDLDDWEKYGESGYTVIQLSDDAYVTTDVSTQTDFSYTYYTDIQWFDTMNPLVASGWTTNTALTRNYQIPILAESQYFVELPSDEEGMKHDGFGLTQRFWFRQEPDPTGYVRGSDINHELIKMSIPTNQRYGLNLSYKNTEKSILTEYFNTRPLLDSNYVDVDVRLSPKEFVELSSGAKVKFDDDVYYTAQIEEYDPSGESPTHLKLVKKTD